MIQKTFLRAAAAAALLCAAAAPAAAGVVYAANNHDLYTLNRADGSATRVGALLDPTLNRQLIDMTAAGSQLYGLVQQLVGNVIQSNLVRIDATTAALTELPQISGIFTNSGPARRIDTIAYDALSGQMYGVNNGPNRSLYTLDLVTGAATRIAALPPVSSPNIQYRSLAFGAGGQLFATLTDLNSNAPSQLVRLDTGTGAQTVIGDTLLGQLGDLAYDADDGVLYGGGFKPGSTLASWFSMDTATGAATELGSSVEGLWAGLAVLPANAAVPEPGTLLLSGLALTGLLAGQRRRTRSAQPGA